MAQSSPRQAQECNHEPWVSPAFFRSTDTTEQTEQSDRNFCDSTLEDPEVLLEDLGPRLPLVHRK
jgi:hypothetical protein